MIEEIKEHLNNIIDKREIIKDEEILIDLSYYNGASITSKYNGTTVKELLEHDDDHLHGDNEKTIKFLVQLSNIIRHFSSLDDSDHVDYRFKAGLYPNSEAKMEELSETLEALGVINKDENFLNKLYDEGYEIIKRVD